MKLPLRIHHDCYGAVWVIDADHRVVCSSLRRHDIKFARAMMRKFNRHWRWVLFGSQPYVYSRDYWLSEKNRKQARAC